MYPSLLLELNFCHVSFWDSGHQQLDRQSIDPDVKGLTTRLSQYSVG